ncbi:OsmC family protein [Alsobacter sp. SYSU M60028]|uniref:OsmC family protein n=1 Tax=Alsobacter ponti TaxID=2962936 RepID=A0ABT1L994_9HYPH|nr:OsmC family protein [Alsobacter ponti]MCP8937618.1 OsmC family protein [Alsobacter ponti]
MTTTEMTSTTTTSAPRTGTKPPPVRRNGVDTPTLLATINAVGQHPELAKFQFRATNRWLTGTYSRTTMMSFAGAGGEHTHKHSYHGEGDHPTVLCGADQAPTPVEWVLHALATCLTAGIANIAAARGVTLTKVESTLEGDIDLRGILGLSQDVRNGYEALRVTIAIDGDAPRAKLDEIVQQAKARSAVFDVITNGIPVSVATAAA